MVTERKNNNFDFLRLSLSLIIAFFHLLILTNSTNYFSYVPYFTAEITVDSFFIISGFLIFISYENSHTLLNYYKKRLRRILPAYIIMIVSISILLYFISTSKNFVEYFNIDYSKYLFFNLITLNFLQPTLPTLFEDNTFSTINGALWTIKIEIMFYISVPLIVYLIRKFNRSLVILLIYTLSIIYTLIMVEYFYHTNLQIYMTLEKQLPGQLAFFISGAALYYYNAFFIKYKHFLLISASITLYIHLNIQPVYILYPISLAIVILYIATVMTYLGNFSRYGDLSFGIYIWHFPIIQTLIALHLFDNFWVGTIIFIFLILIASLFSWHVIEKRFLFNKITKKN